MVVTGRLLGLLSKNVVLPLVPLNSRYKSIIDSGAALYDLNLELLYINDLATPVFNGLIKLYL
jgi:hypothetical protein